MWPSRLSDRFVTWLRRTFRADHSALSARRGIRTHVIVLDGTMSSLVPGEETNAGITYRLLEEMNGQLSLYYEAGIQWQEWRSTADVLTGRGINRQIRRAYGFLASRYRPGDRIFLFGYSRGAYAVRSLAGLIDRVGLLRAEEATVRNIRTIYRLYESDPAGPVTRSFGQVHCHPQAPIEMIGVWDTVKALGLRLPVLWRWIEDKHGFHNHELGASIRHGYHALALNETRHAYAPVLWTSPPDWPGKAEQVWFRGTHGDVGGQLNGHIASRPLANIPLVWMLGRAEACGLPLPDGWRARFPCDVTAPSVGTWNGTGKLFWFRRARTVGRDASERLHESVGASDHPAHPGEAQAI
ncbi:DUF2235 domain-containing protein [Primorskyibacter flagellatus]|uniref:Uncharacterized alpha/beta hydrolase domain n=1 Tax=Primorskyibacter flagellatus TaxID=1387277 RepID=A0A1W2CVC7_9RHOB|nr:DUF2235 domain-containing protein [Primorskyibacter flagellatus]SMC88916.1 Uncharacterized alpha/beta hydrolase domain [Primorskyibacter flagellatus]